MHARDIGLVSLGAGALITLVAGTALGLDRRVEAWMARSTAPDAVAPEVPDEDLRPLPIRPPSVAPTAPEAAAPRPEEPLDRDDVVPDLEGMRVGEARRRMRERGLRLIVRDENGLAIAPEDSALYRVDAVDPPAGTPAEPGATVRARARAPRLSVFSGY